MDLRSIDVVFVTEVIGRVWPVQGKDVIVMDRVANAEIMSFYLANLF